MLQGLFGIRLVLLLGKKVPRPAAYDVITALTRAEVTNDVDSEGGDGFQLTFSVGKTKSGEYDLLQSGALDADTRVVVGIVMGVTPVPLIDGIIYHTQLLPGEQPGTASVVVSGRDVSVMMDLEETDANYRNQSDSVIVTQLLANYAQFGILPPFQVTPTTEVPVETQLTPSQHETDLHYIKRLAVRNGFQFFVEPLTLGVNRAYWGPESRIGEPQPALSHNLGPSSNVRTLRASNDALAPVSTRGQFVEPITKTSVTIPALPSLRVPPLSASPVEARRTTRLRCTANRSPGRAATEAISTVTNAREGVTVEGELDTVRYGSVLRPRRPVGVRGMGKAHDGLYYVRRVTHRIERGTGGAPFSYTQTFKLSREGTGSLLPVVRP